MSKYIKARTWGMVVYPQSAPEDWVELLRETYIQFAVSPLHDKDVNPDGEIKKEHWHVILIWDGPVTQNAALKIAEKYQYDEKDIKIYNGFDISNYIALTREEKYEAISRIKRIIVDENITEYIDLLSLLEEMDYNLFKVACDNTFTINVLVRSNRHKHSN